MSPTMRCTTREMYSPVGVLLLSIDGEGALERLDFLSRRTRDQVEEELAGRGREVVRDQGAGGEIARQLSEYFCHQRQVFELPLAPGGTEFQSLAWRALAEIPFGETRSYAQQAESMGRPNAIRAIGRANGANPIPIVLPCHRVIGANGSLRGYTGGLDIKRWLLHHEGAARPSAGQQLALL